MIAYKGFNANLMSVLGNGNKETCTFEQGKTYREKGSKTGKEGFHCCENPFACLRYYPLNGNNRFFMVEAEGNIDEDDIERITCTKITLRRELSILEFALEGMKYMITHPDRSGWKQNYKTVMVKGEEVKAESDFCIAISRGPKPIASGVKGSILGWILEPEPGNIQAAKLFCVTEEYKNKRLTLTGNRELQEVEN